MIYEAELPFSKVSVSQICLLFILDMSDTDPAVHELAERLKLSVAATGRAVDGLVKTGMVTRNDALLELVDAGQIEPREAYIKSAEKTAILASLKAKRHDVSFVEG